MGLIDYLLPYRALREARGHLRVALLYNKSLRERLNNNAKTIRQLESDLAAKTARVRLQKEEIMRLHALQAKTNPAGDTQNGNIDPDR